MQYLNDSLCNNTNRWYLGYQRGWTTTYQAGCPNAHIHLARRTDYIDGVNLTVTANYTDGNSTVESSLITFAELPNLAPSPTGFTYPVNGTYSGNINITWQDTIDPNGDIVTYNLSLLNADGSYNQTLNTSTTLASYYWNSSNVSDGVYDLRVVACDPSNACSNFTLGGSYGNFTVDNIADVATSTTTTEETTIPTSTGGGGYPIFDLDLEKLITYNKILFKNWKIDCDIGNYTYSLIIKEIEDSCTKISVKEKDFCIEESYRFDLDDDGYYDVEILKSENNLKNKGINLTFFRINAKVLEEHTEEVQEEDRKSVV